MQTFPGSLDPQDEIPTEIVAPAGSEDTLIQSTLFASDAPVPVDPPAISPAPRTRREAREQEARRQQQSVAAPTTDSSADSVPASSFELTIDDVIAGRLSGETELGGLVQGADAASADTRASLRSRSGGRARTDTQSGGKRSGGKQPGGKRSGGKQPGAERPGTSARRAVTADARRVPTGRRRATRSAMPRVAAEVTATAVPVRARVALLRRRVVSNLITASAMAGVGLILVATTVPANAFSRPDMDPAADAARSSQTLEAQKFTVDEVPTETVTRDAFSVVSLQQQVAARGANRLLNYTNNPAGTIQWPFPSGVPITSGFGGRHVAGCGFCSTYHEGLDFTPGTGTPINSIADGVVSKVERGGAFGHHVVVDHVINGQKVQSLYAHMQAGSVKVAVGEQLTVGQQIGAVGSTGASTGAHLHLEVHLDGVPVDPFSWLQANAN